jgi:antitoxin MazE
MVTKIIKIGNSRGIRIPKSSIEKLFPNNKVNLEVQENGIFLKPISKSRENWDSLFNTKNNIPDIFIQNDFDESEWEW